MRVHPDALQLQRDSVPVDQREHAHRRERVARQHSRDAGRRQLVPAQVQRRVEADASPRDALSMWTSSREDGAVTRQLYV